MTGHTELQYLIRRPAVVLSIVVILLVIAWALFPGLFTSHSAIEGVPADKLHGPSGSHPFGTDNLGRDQFARVVHGAALSLKASVLAVLVASVVGSLLGLLAGYFGGAVDDILMRIVDVMLAIPGLLLSLALVTALGFGTIKVAIAVGVASVAGFARVMRAEVLRVRSSVFIEAARSSGVRRFGILRRHILPNSAGPVIVLAALELGTAILAVSALSFLGYGAPPPAPEWGSLVAGGRDYLGTAWWMTTFPGLVVAVVAIAANRISRALEEVRG